MNKPIHFAVVLVAICASATRASGQEPRTFSRDVAPVLFKHCVGCHRPGQTAPFSLQTFEDVRPRAARIADVTRARVMPPWKPDPGHGRFQDARQLTDTEIAAIQEWVEQGMMRGNAADLPPPPEFSDAWQLGTPDVIVEMPEAYMLPAQRNDVFRTLRDSDSLENAGLRPCSGIPAGKREGRASRQHQGRSYATVEEAGRRRGGTGIRGRRKPRGEVPRRDVSRMDAGAVATHLAQGNELASRAAQRSRRRAPSDACRGA